MSLDCSKCCISIQRRLFLVLDTRVHTMYFHKRLYKTIKSDENRLTIPGKKHDLVTVVKKIIITYLFPIFFHFLFPFSKTTKTGFALFLWLTQAQSIFLPVGNSHTRKREIQFFTETIIFIHHLRRHVKNMYKHYEIHQVAFTFDFQLTHSTSYVRKNDNDSNRYQDFHDWSLVYRCDVFVLLKFQSAQILVGWGLKF